MNRFSAIPNDTSREAYWALTAALRRMGPERRAAMTFELNDQLRARLAAGVRMRHPDYDNEQVRLATIRLRLGDDWFRRAFPEVEVTP
jgi:hypothetical protein